MTHLNSSRQNNHEEVVDKTVLTAYKIKQNKYKKAVAHPVDGAMILF